MIEFDFKKIISYKEKDMVKKVEKEVIKKEFEFIIIKVDSKKIEQNFKKLKDFIKTLKKYFNLFIILKTDIPNSKYKVELLFSSGSHGVYFIGKGLELVKYATELYSKGMVFFESTIHKKETIKGLIKENIIPVIKNCDIELSKYIREKIDENKKLKGYLKYIPLIEQVDCKYAMSNKIEKRMKLEFNNIRQKLMTKNIEKSFDSSSL